MSIVGYLKDVNDAENLYEIMAGTLTIGRGEGNDVKIASRYCVGLHCVQTSARFLSSQVPPPFIHSFLPFFPLSLATQSDVKPRKRYANGDV